MANTDQTGGSPTAEQIADMLRKVDAGTAKKVMDIINKDRIFAGCATFTCSTKIHGEIAL